MTTTVRDLMSFGVHTVQPDLTVQSLLGRLRRIGHEGYPVVEEGQVIGLLTSRDMNRAAENHLSHLTIREVMQAGEINIYLDASLGALLRMMVESDWGQIPVMDRTDKLIGIVTRTDVIKHYANLELEAVEHQIAHDEIAAVLGQPIADLIAFVANQAHHHNLTSYMVGGVVRDLLLKRPNLDIDFAFEGNAITFAKSLQAQFGGELHIHEAFVTAKWIFDDSAANHIGHPLNTLPDSIDLVTARHEFYEEPAVLPTVYNSGIKLDLRRRDFTVNALAVQLGTDGASGTIIDLFGGLDDLQQGVIRALHSLSFADDPTRSLRAVRYAHRLNFAIEPRTSALIQTALPMMGQITGERLKNELTLLLKEPQPEVAILKLQAMGILRAMHPSFIVDQQITAVFARARPYPAPTDDIDLYHWALLATCLSSESLPNIAERLLIGKRWLDVMQSANTLTLNPDEYLAGKASAITFRLDAVPILALEVAAVVLENDTHRQTLQIYRDQWRHIKPNANGNVLKSLGLPPGPRYKTLLQALRAARIDGEITSDDDEARYLQHLIESE